VNAAFHFSAWHGWTAAAVVLLICEVITTDFLPTTFAIACGAAAIVDVTGHGTINQLIAFSVTLLVVLAFIRPVVRRSLYHTSDRRALNVEGIVGQTGTVVEPIGGTGLAGRVKLGGEVWRALSTAGDSLPEGATVRVTAVDSATVHVTAI
jgi:membrane protein implicated in regulation of membrane protease activity